MAGAIYGLYAADTLLAMAVTGADGQAEFTVDLPLGNYYVIELEAPAGYTSSRTEERIDVNASYAGQNTQIQVLDGFVFQNQKTRNVFTKSDISSGALLSGALLEIREICVDEGGKPVRDEEGRFVTTLVESWVSDAKEVHYFFLENDVLMEIPSADELPEGRELIVKYGHLVETLQAGRQYLFREITAPWGYVGYDWSEESVRQANREENLSVEEIRFTVEDSQMVAEHDMKDQRTMGKLAITKEGEFVVTAQKSFWEKAGDFFRTVFRYLLGRVENVTFEVRAAEDIYTPDQTGTIAVYGNGRDEVALVKDALVATITTDVNGVAVLENLPLGRYYITETGVGEGEFLLNRTAAEVLLAYPGQKVLVAAHDAVKYQNERQRVALTVVKKSRNADEARILNTGETLPADGSDRLIAGAVFGLYTAEDMTGFEVDPETGAVKPCKNVLLAADTLIETAATGRDGSVTFLSDLPCGKYYVKELQAPAGYLMSDEVDEAGTVVDEWRSDGTIHYIRNLEPGKRYTVTETEAAPGYAVAESIVFELVQPTDENGRLLQAIRILTDERYFIDGIITMKDDRLPEVPNQPEQPGQPQEDRPGEGGGDTGDSGRIIAGLCVFGIGLAGLAGYILHRNSNLSKKKKEDHAENP